MDEIWKDIEGFEGYYQISNFGNIKATHRIVYNLSGKRINSIKKERSMKVQRTIWGYSSIMLSLNGVVKNFVIHRLVAQAFIPNPENKPEVNHIDGNKQNNHISNLEWATRSENQKHAFRIGLNKSNGTGKFGEESIHSKAIYQYSTENNYIKKYNSVSEAHRYIGVSLTNISKCARGKQKTAGGFIWRYEQI